MLNDLLAPYLNVRPQEVARMLSLKPDQIYADETYRKIVASLNSSVLQKTSDYAYDTYEKKLPVLKEKYGLAGTVMSGYTLCNWVLGFLMYPETMPDMLERHARIPTSLVADMLPELITALDDLPSGRADWQRALIAFSLPLLANRA